MMSKGSLALRQGDRQAGIPKETSMCAISRRSASRADDWRTSRKSRHFAIAAPLAGLALSFALLGLLIGETAAQTYSYTYFDVGGSYVMGITSGPDGNIWYTEYGSDKIGRISPAGVISKFGAGITPGGGPLNITAGPDGNLWFTEYPGNRVGRITPAGVITEFSTGISAGAGPTDIVAGPDGNLWFTERDGGRIGRITPDGVVTEFGAEVLAGTGPEGITAGRDGNLWFTEFDVSRIGKITPAGVVTQYGIGITSSSGLLDIVSGPDGNLWFTELYGDRIGRITPTGMITEFSAGISAGAGPAGITTGPDGNLWFVESGWVSHLARLAPNGAITELSGPGGTAITTGPDGGLWFTQQRGTVVRATVANYQGLWWRAPADSESGWGINLAHQGDVIFATWYTYDASGKAWWLSMSANKAAENVYSGALYQTKGPPLDARPFDPNQVTRTPVGTGTLSFTTPRSGTFAYSINGISQTKAIVPQEFGPLPTCVWGAQPDLTKARNYQDLWWVSPPESESGWGVNFTHQGNTIFVTWFTYDFAGMPMWLSATAPKTATGSYVGTLFLTTGPAFNTDPFDPRAVTRAPVGTIDLSFANGNRASFAYRVTLPGSPEVVDTKVLTRQLLRSPGTICY